MTNTAPRLSSLYLSNLGDAAGTKLFDTVISLTVVLHLGFSATQLGLLNFLGALSFFLLAVPAGIIVDRIGAVPALLSSLLAKTVFIFAVLALFYYDALNATTTLILVTVLGALSLFTETAQTTVAPLLVHEERKIADVVAKLAAADQVMSVAVPVAGGLLFALSGSLGGLLTAAALALIAALAALRLWRIRARSTASPAQPAAAGDSATAAAVAADAAKTQPAGVLAGFKVIFRHRLLLATTLLVAAGNIGLAIGDTLTDLLLLRYMGVSPFVYGLLEGIGAIAGIIAALLSPRLLDRLPTSRIFGCGAVAQGLIACLPLVALTVPALSYPAMFLLSAGWAFIITVTNIAGSAYAAQVVPQRVLGRSIGARRMLTMGAVPFAALSSGILADLFDLWLPLLLWPAITLAAALLFFLLARPLQQTSPSAP
ncbi:MFS transporter [Leucobacter sp. OH2974_COT-288]|nr:MFS transporter [Leucobacter sp. OH2974_COT-288]